MEIEEMAGRSSPAPWSRIHHGPAPHSKGAQTARTAFVAGILAAAGVCFLAVLWFLLGSRPKAPKTGAEFFPKPNIEAEIAQARARLSADPQDISALVKVGELHFDQGRDHYLDAINELESAWRLGALDPRIFYWLGIMYQEEGIYDYALTNDERYLRHYPDDNETRLREAKLYYLQGRYGDAARAFEFLAEKYPDDGLVAENWGLSLWKAGQADKAQAIFSGLASSAGDSGRRAQYYLGEINRDQNHYEEALAYLMQAEQGGAALPQGIAPQDFYSTMAKIQQKLGNSAEAGQAWNEVLRLDKANREARSALRVLRRSERRKALRGRTGR